MTSTNPATEEVIFTTPELTLEEVQARIARAKDVWRAWRETSFAERAALLRTVGELCRSRSRVLGTLATLEMGKPITQAIAEVEKCALACEYYAQNGEKILANEVFGSDAAESFARFDPIGGVLAVMPWNFPYWQVMRFAAPALMAGNVGLLKHASNVPQCAMALERLFLDAGFPEGVFQNLLIRSGQVKDVLNHPFIQGVALTGSESAGSQVAALAGSLIKRSVLELGGSDPFVVLSDADVEQAAEVACKARFQNNGQSCIAAKRFIVVDALHDAFIAAFVRHAEALVIGDPMDLTTTLGPMVDGGAREEIERQVTETLAKGGKLLTGGKRKEGRGFFYEPTIIDDVGSGMPLYDEEVFGPAAAVIRAKDDDDAIRIANDTRFGLGSSIWTKDVEKAKTYAAKIRAGCVFVNGMVKSDPRLPFGGTGVSGYGRELSTYGIKEFVNIKTVWIK